jgi:hypothetical protein
MRSGSGAQFLFVKPAMPHKLSYLSLERRTNAHVPAAKCTSLEQVVLREGLRLKNAAMPISVASRLALDSILFCSECRHTRVFKLLLR